MSSGDTVKTVTITFDFNIQGVSNDERLIYNPVSDPVAFRSNRFTPVEYNKTVSAIIKSINDDKITGNELPNTVILTYSEYGLDSTGLDPQTYIPPIASDVFLEINEGEGTSETNATITDKSSESHTIVAQGDAQQSSFSPYEDDLSVYFDGSGDSLVTDSSTDFAFGTNNFTIETWVKPETSSFYLLESTDKTGIHLGYNIDSQDQGLLLGLAGLSSQESAEEVDEAYALGGDRTYYITENGVEYTVHEFTNTALSTIEVVGDLTAEVLTVGGGGGAGNGDDDGGGGAGGLLFQPQLSFTSGTYDVKVGAGGSANTNGDDSYIATAGGIDVSRAIGGGAAGNSSNNQGSDGGSGGGGEASSSTNNPGGTALQPSSTFGGFGNNGGLSGTSTGTPYEGAGGGGAGAPGADHSGNSPGSGGDGLYQVTLNGTVYNFNSMFGSVGEIIDGESWFAGGGAGGGETASGSGVVGGKGGGGAYNKEPIANTGGGGGAYDDDSPQSDTQPGGSGVIYIRYPKVVPPAQLDISNQTQEAGIDYQDTSLEKTRMLIRADGTGTNTNIIDSSSQQRSISILGNTKLSGLTPLTPNKWSYRFDGSNDYFYSGEVWDSLTNVSDPWTLEFWMHLNAGPNTDNIPIGINSKSAGTNIFLYFGGTVNINGTNISITNIETNKWVHVALVYDGTNIKVYHDGTEVYSNTANWSTALANCYLAVGAEFDGANATSAGNYTPCFITDMRASAAAVYTANFTPPTSLLEKNNDTIFLSLRKSNIYDESDSAATILYGNSPKAYPFSIFKPEAEYNLTVQGGSAVMDGSGDGLDPGFQLPGTGDWTFETWFKTDSVSRHNIFGQYAVGGNGRTLFYVNPDQSYKLEFFSSGDGSYDPWHIRSTETIQPFQWYHTALVRSGNVFSMYLNGKLEGTLTSSHTLLSQPFLIGSSTQSVMNGYLADTHVTFSAKYSAEFTIPTELTEADANTQLLLRYATPNVWDFTANTDLRFFGNATSSTSVTKYADASMYFDGSGDYIRNDEVFDGVYRGTPWTAECWLYLTRAPSGGNDYFFALNSAGNGNNNMIVSPPDVWVNNSSRGNLSSAITSANTWYHVAIVYDGSQVEIFVDGVSAFTYGAALNFDPTGQVFAIGAEFDAANGGTPGNYFQGYIEDYRITIGEARYSANFTPPAESLGTSTQLPTLQPGTPPAPEDIQDVEYGRDIEFTIEAVGVADGTNLSYAITGVTSSDINGASLTGTLAVSNEQASLTVETSSNNSVPKTLTFTVTYPDATTDLDIINLVNPSFSLTYSSYVVDEFLSTGSASWTVPDTVEQIDVLVVAGGGSGGVGHSSGSCVSGGGGGAGGIVLRQNHPVVSGDTYSITVGTGGSSHTGYGSSAGNNGEDSVFDNLIALGGGGGGTRNSGGIAGRDGGSGGGGNHANGTAGTGLQPTSASGGFGNDGGGGFDGGGCNADGGGGAGSPGLPGFGNTAGDGGSGLYFGDIFGDSYGENGWFGGGGGAGLDSTGMYGAGGIGGGGSSNGVRTTPNPGVANTGGGGAGGANSSSGVTPSGAGGTGVVLIRYGIPDTISAPASVEFGQNIVYGINVPNLNDDDTISYTITGVNSTDILGGQLSGTMTVQSGSTSVNINTNPQSGGLKTLTFTITLPDNSTESISTVVFRPIAIVGGGSLNLNQWNHIAVSRYFDEFTFFINGTKTQAAQTNSIDYGILTQGLTIGSSFTGYMRDLYITKNFAKYLNDFQPPESTIQESTGAILLTCQPSIENTNYILDKSSLSHTITVNGDINTVYQTPYNRQRFIPDQNIGSAVFDGSGDHIEIANETSLDLSGGAWTVECWVYPTGNYSIYRTIFAKRVTGSSTTSYEGYLRTGSGVISFYNGSNFESTTVLDSNAWSHCAWVYDGTDIYIYVNGNNVYSSAVTITEIAEPLVIGGARGYNEWFDGNIADFRIVKGSAVYTENFIPPQEPLTDISNTVLLLNFDSAKMYDDVGRNSLRLYSGATNSNSVVNQSTSSLDFTGPKYAVIDKDNTPVNYSTDLTWTVSFNFYLNSYNNDTCVASYGWRSGTYGPWLFYMDSANRFKFYASSNNASWNIADTVILNSPTSGWYSVEIQRNDTVLTVKLNGEQAASYSVSGTWSTYTEERYGLGAGVNGANSSDVFVENFQVRNTAGDPIVINQLGFVDVSNRESSYNVQSVDVNDPNIEFKFFSDKLSHSNSPVSIEKAIGISFPVISFRTESKIQFVTLADGTQELQVITPENDPTLDRNPRPAGEEGPTTIVEINKPGLWY